MNPSKIPSKLLEKNNRLPRVLVVDDEPLIRQLYAEVLRELGYDVNEAEDGRAAWKALQTVRYDLLITDSQMPNMTGVELIKRVHEARIEVPVIMATATLPDDDFKNSPWLKPNATLLKPFAMKEFSEALKTVLRPVSERV
jgi:DNA-binding response OmpR family regulator